MTLPLERALWEISVQTAPGAKLAAAYELPWFFLGLTRRALDPPTDAPLAACLERCAGRARQQTVLGHRPYHKDRFEYAAADADRAVAERALHWLRVALLLWRTELARYAGVTRFGPLPDGAREVLGPDGAPCPCGLCATLAPSPAHEARLLARLEARQTQVWPLTHRGPCDGAARHGPLSALPRALTPAERGQGLPRLQASRSAPRRRLVSPSLRALSDPG